LGQLNQHTFRSYLQEQYGRTGEGVLTDFLSRQNETLLFGDQVNLHALAQRYGAPLEVAFYPLITRQVRRMQGWARQAQRTTGYAGEFVYAYATKANFSAEVVQTALDAGAHYETSAAADMEIAGHLWRQGILPAGRIIFCNGSKEPAYLDAIVRLRREGCRTVLPILDDLSEWDALRDMPEPLLLGVRERAAGTRDGRHPGNDRFGLTKAEIAQLAAQVQESHHHLVLYHAMVGSQLTDAQHALRHLDESIVAYCRLRQQIPSLRWFNIGGGVPTSGYTLDFQFDYAGFLRTLMTRIREVCAAYGVPEPGIVGEFGRYTVANHSMYLFEVGTVKRGQSGSPDWYLINGSLMVSMPDMLLVPEQQFVVLPLDDWDAPLRPVRLASRITCDSDDVYPHPSREPLYLPDSGAGLRVAIFGTGAYQKQLAGMGGAHHCLSPEPQRVALREEHGSLMLQTSPQQDQSTIMRLLGYGPQIRTLPQPTASAPLREALPLPPRAGRKAS
jgi:arginine decarboxylase